MIFLFAVKVLFCLSMYSKPLKHFSVSTSLVVSEVYICTLNLMLS